MLWKELIEDKSERTAKTIKADATAIGRLGPCFKQNDYSIEKEQYSPSLMLAYRIAEVFGVTVEELCCLKENRELEDKDQEAN